MVSVDEITIDDSDTNIYGARMSSAAPNHLHDQLPADAYYHLVRTLCLTLPPPLTDSPDALAQRNHAAITRIAALIPANPAEADLAAMFVAASEQSKDCLRLAQLSETTPERALKCRAQALSMMREAKSALRLLLRLQEAREKREADGASCNRAAWTEHCAIGLMAEALSPAAARAAPGHPTKSGDFAGTPPAPCEPAPAKAGDTGIAKRPTPPPEPAPLEPRPRPAPVEDAEPEPDPIAEAEQYAAIYPERAALIRRLGRVPENASFGPPDPDLVQALITARTPALAALDREFAQACLVRVCPGESRGHGAHAA